MKKNLIVAYESRFARCGGITAVLNFLPLYLRHMSGITTSVITPFHHKIKETKDLPVGLVGEIDVPFIRELIRVRVYRHDDRFAWYLLDAAEFKVKSLNKEEVQLFSGRLDSQTVQSPAVEGLDENGRHFFSGKKHPYDVGSNAEEQWAILRRDAMFFGAAVARALPILDLRVRWNIIMQDWQAATAALALAIDEQHPHGLFLTLHNSYDSGAIFPRDLRAVGIDPAKVPGPHEGSTVLKRAIPLVDKPIFSVSEQFARDFVEDPLQSSVMAPHLQRELQFPWVVGVNNGLFAELAVPQAALAKARAKRPDYTPIQEWKAEQKMSAMEALHNFEPEMPDKPAWGDKNAFIEHAKKAQPPWFVLAGRDDTRQKGYDVACHAIGEFLADPNNRERAQFLLFPIPGDEGREGLRFLENLATDFPANVLALPFIFQEGYFSALRGAAFGIMSSLYEPFGMANEFYLNGAVGIGRATGGLLQQIVPLRSATCCTTAVIRRSERWHNSKTPHTGFLYSEGDELSPNDVIKDWQVFNNVKYLTEPHCDRLVERRNLALFRAMSAGLQQAIQDALAAYHQPPGKDGRQLYFSMLAQGIEHLQRGFSWDLAAAAYNSYMQ